VPTLKIIYDPQSGQTNVEFPGSQTGPDKIICDFMLAEAKRILDRIDNAQQKQGQDNGGPQLHQKSNIVIPQINVRGLGDPRGRKT